MPTISNFYGIFIRMFFDDHEPAHFHVQYAEYKAVVAIEACEIIRGQLPRYATAMVLEWTKLRNRELLEDWELCKSKQKPKKIDPLD